MSRIRKISLYLTALLLASGYPVMAMAEAPVATQPDTVIEAQVIPTTETTGTQQPESAPSDGTALQLNPSTGTYETTPAATETQNTPEQTEPSGAAPADPSNQASTDVTTNVGANNQVTSTATTGNATVSSNTTAGSATSGAATATTTILNNVNSVITAGENQKAANFTYDVLGDVNGDIMLYPLLLKSMLESNATNTGSGANVAAMQNTAITNDVSLQATSGNAAVTNNTNAGNATTGSANTVANIMNVLNSMISANKSFVGTVNIYGNLNGDILIAPDFIPQMIASNGSAQTPADTAATSVQSTDTQTIMNNVSLAAESGAAAVTNNTNAGNATTGSANTNVVIFNLSGHAIVAKNSLLVFVNVLGEWVGVIVDAPTGATSALVGDGVSSDTVTTPDLTVHTQTNTVITNNVTLSSHSGNALVNGNTNAGNATTGNATASANIANISSSQLGLSDWFGVLFINVFSSWHGSFGVNTSYGDPIASDGGSAGPSSGQTQSAAIAFIPRAPQSRTSAPTTTIIDSQLPEYAASDDSAVLGATTAPSAVQKSNGSSDAPQVAAAVKDYRLPIVIGSLFVIGVTGIALRKLLSTQA